MKFFLQIETHIRIVNDTSGWQEWQGTLTEFMALEPEYPGLPAEPAGLVLRSQTDERQYLQDADGGQYPDAFNALGYCDTIGTYPAWSPPDPDSLIDDAITATDSTWSSTKIDSEIADGGGGGGLPVGVALIWFAAIAPDGWYLADGAAVDESLPIGVWALSIGMVSNDNGTVNLPDMRLRVPMMAGTGFALLSTGGEAAVALTGVNNGPHSHQVRVGWNNINGTVISKAGTNYGDWFTTTESGSGTPHNNLQPYVTINFIIFGG